MIRIITSRAVPNAHRLGRFVWLTLAGLTLAGIVHIISILMIPSMADRDAATLFAELGEKGHADLVAKSLILDSDPFTVTAVCGFDLTGGPFRISARAGVVPLSLSVHRPGGGVSYAITDRAAVRGLIEFVIMTPRQLEDRLARDDEEETVRELRVVSPEDSGILVARSLVRRPSDRPEAEALVKGVACGAAD